MIARVVLTGILCAPMLAVPATAQNVVDPVRALYAAADYEGALAILDEAGGAAEGAPSLAADRLRAFCLLALGRPEEADAVIARIVTAHPADDPGDEVSPRLRIAFRAVRDRVVPAVALQSYDAGRAAFDRGAYVDAVEHFTRALPAIEALAMDGHRDMEDLRVLTNGFLSLAGERAPPARADPPPLLTARMRPAAGLTAPAPTTDSRDTLQTPPSAIRQPLPPWTAGPRALDSDMRGLIEVRIDDTGRVVEARLLASVHPQYDLELLRAARRWLYEPARRAGQAVASLVRVEVLLPAR